MRALMVIERGVYEGILETGKLVLHDTLEERETTQGKFIEYYSELIRQKTNWDEPFNRPIIGYTKVGYTPVKNMSDKELIKMCEGLSDPVMLHVEVPTNTSIRVNAEHFDSCLDDIECGYNFNLRGFKETLLRSVQYTFKHTSTELIMVPVIYKENIIEAITI